MYNTWAEKMSNRIFESLNDVSFEVIRGNCIILVFSVPEGYQSMANSKVNIRDNHFPSVNFILDYSNRSHKKLFRE